MIQLKNISKHYSQGFGKTHVLRYVDLDIEKGDFVTIMGHEAGASCHFEQGSKDWKIKR